MENYRYDFHFYPCDENGNVIEEQARHFSSNDLATGLNKAAQFYRSQKYVPTVNIFDNEANEYIAEWNWMLTQNDNRDENRILSASNSKTPITMRQIEKQMLAAVKNGRNFKSSNTEVETQSNGNTYVYLFGNCIYKIVNGTPKFNLCGWNSATTRSRLNALGVNVTSKNGKPHYNGKPISANSGWIAVQWTETANVPQ